MSSQKTPIISLIIPTRERAETLKYTIQTALNQSSDYYEIIISDNYSQDGTQQIVKEFKDSRIVYLNTGKRLSMCDNWDFALPHAQGDYVIVIGDDDGMMPNAIDQLQRIIVENPSPIYTWETHEYFWPIGDSPPMVGIKASKQDSLKINLYELVRFSLRWGGWRYGSLPILYHSAVSRQILDKIREQTGRVFHSTIPDVFMAFALPNFSDSAIKIGESLTVNGRSAKSNSSKFIVKDGDEVFQKFVDEYGDYHMHETLDPKAPFYLNMMADSALVAMDLFPKYYKDASFNYAAMWAHMNRISFFEHTGYILSRRNEIRKFHPFSVSMFLIYTVIHKILAFRIKIRGTLSKNQPVKLPLDVNEFVQYMASHT